MQNKKKSLLIASVVLVLLSAVLVLLLATNSPEDAAQLSSSEEKILLQSDQQVTSIAVQTPNESYTILPVEGSGEDPQWQIADLEGIPQSQTKYSDLMSICAKLEYTQKLENPKELSVYGLQEPAAKAQISYADGSSTLLLVGNVTTDGSGVYCKLDSDSSIYICSAVNGQKFTRDLLSYVDLSLVPKIDSDSTPGIESVSIERYADGTSYTVERRASEGDAESTALWLTSPREYQLAEEAAKTLLALISSFSADETVAIHPSPDQMTEYGFSQPTARIRYTINGSDYTLLIGKGIEYTEEEDTLGLGGIGSYYIQLEGRDVIYTVSIDNLGWLNLQY